MHEIEKENGDILLLDINIDCPGLQLLHIQKAEEQAEIVIIQ